MILREIDFHFISSHPEDVESQRNFRLQINHIIDSIYVQLKPLKIKTEAVIKLNCNARSAEPEKEFWSHEGIGMVYTCVPYTEDVLKLDQKGAERVVLNTIRKCIAKAAKYDAGIANGIEKILSVVNASESEFEFYRKIGKSHKSRKYRCESVIHLKPYTYSSIVEISDKNGNIERHVVKEFEAFLFGSVFPESLSWDGNSVVGFYDNEIAFRIVPKMLGN